MNKESLAVLFLSIVCLTTGQAQTALPNVNVEGQPLGANVARLVQAMEFLGMPLGLSLIHI